MAPESFASLPDLSGYTIGSRGTVISHLRGRPFKVAVSVVKPGGYRRVDLRPDTGPEHRTYVLARLVLEAHGGPPPTPGAECRYRDGDPSNVDVSNLYWRDPSEEYRTRREDAAVIRDRMLDLEAAWASH